MHKTICFNKTGKTGKALVHYKTDAFTPGLINRNWRHSNKAEIIAIVNVLVEQDYKVLLVDTGNKQYRPSNDFQLYIGLAAGNSGKYFLDYCEKMRGAIKVAYCAGPDPVLSNQLVEKMYTRHNFLTNRDDPAMRTITKINFTKIAKKCDAIIALGERGMFSFKTYEKYKKPIYPLAPTINPNIKFMPFSQKHRDKSHFICFAGSGFICKGVHHLVKAFKLNPKLSLHICGPKDEPAFWSCYGDQIQSSPNIHYHGLVKPGSKKYQNIISKCSYSVLYSASEGCATSVLNVMAAGAVPIVNFRCGLNNDLFPISFDDDIEDEVGHISEMINVASKLSDNAYQLARSRAQEYSNNFRLKNFKQSFKFIIKDLTND